MTDLIVQNIVNSFIESLISFPSIPVENGKILSKISDEANEIIRGLHAIDEEGKNIAGLYFYDKPKLILIQNQN